MLVIHALFDSYSAAANAVRALKASGIDDDNISLISNHSDFREVEPERPAAEGAEMGADIGGIVGGMAGLLAGLGVVTIPGLGPVVAAGWLVGSSLGLAAGGAIGLASGALIGALTFEGIPHDTAHAYNEGIKIGGTLVAVRVHTDRVDEAEAILGAARQIDVEARTAKLS